MKNKALLEEIAKNNTIVEYHIKRLKKKPDQLHEIDIDLLTEKLKTLYSLVHELETGKAISFPKQEIVEVAEVDESVTEDAVIEEVLVEKESVPEMIVEVPEKKEVIEVEAETVASVEEVVKVKESSEVEVRSSELTEPQAEPEEKPKTTADLFTGTTTIADTLKNKEDISIAAKGRQQPLDDLKKAIGINDKFLFINELFKGDPANYNNVIDKLNTAEAITDASNLMNGYMKEFAWSVDGAAYQRLAKLVESKFA
jgi:hypothetical protein